MKTNGQMDLIFNAQISRELKEEGIAAAAESKKDLLEIAREVARKIAIRNGSVDADQVQKVMVERGIDLGPAAGAIFKEKCWEFTGEFRGSERIKNHARLLRVWRLK